MDLYNSVSPDSLKQAYNEVNRASIDDGSGPLKLKLTRKEKLKDMSKVEIAEEAFK